MNIVITELIESNSAVSRVAGEKLYKILEDNFPQKNITLDFDGIEFYATPFFNTSIAPLLEDSRITVLQEKLAFANLSPIGKSILNQVVHNAIEFYDKSEEDRLHLENEVNKNFKDSEGN
jgi:hypothetical protein